MAENEKIIEVKNLTAGYEDIVVIDDVSFSVKRGEIFGILGGSGSGKSTLLKQMIGLRKPMSGEVFIKGVDITKADITEMKELLSEFGVAYQSGALFGSMTIRENIRLVLEEFTDLPEEGMDLIAQTKLKLVGLEETLHKMPSELSGGMQKRVAIARAMALDPEIIFLDEPSAGLDPVTSVELDELILKLSRNLGITFVVVSHELASIFKIADNVIMLDGETKKIIASGKAKEIKNTTENEFVKRFFNREPSNSFFQ